MTSDDRKEQFDMQGAWEKGTARATIDCNIDVGSQDQLIVLDMPVRELEVVTRETVGLVDPLRTHRVVDVIQLRTATKSYKVGVDFVLVVDSDGKSQINWTQGASRPADGEKYSLQMRIEPIWVVASHPMSRTFGSRKNQQLPWRCDLVRYDRALADNQVV